jgi:hypothetical protein
MNQVTDRAGRCLFCGRNATDEAMLEKLVAKNLCLTKMLRLAMYLNRTHEPAPPWFVQAVERAVGRME